MSDMASWMSLLPDKLKIFQMTMPGSHDAGISHTDSTGTGIVGPIISKSVAICQDVGIGLQCVRGSRFFDVRLEVGNGSIRTYHKTMGQGALGESSSSILNDVYQFLQSQPSEFVILRITKPKGSADEVLTDILQSSLRDRLFKTPNFVNIAQLELGTLRGKAVCCFDTEKTSATKIGPITIKQGGKVPFKSLMPRDGAHSFSRFNGSEQYGVVTCGKYSSSKNLSSVINGQVARYDEHANHKLGSHLFVLYWTQTGGNIEQHSKAAPKSKFAVTQKERQRLRLGGAHHNMAFLTNLLKEGQASKPGVKQASVVATTPEDRRRIMPNVIMYDFVNAQMSEQIVALNNPGLIAHLLYEEENPWEF